MPNPVLVCADMRAALAPLSADSLDGAVTDAPYGLGKLPDPVALLHAWLADEDFTPGGGGFMGKQWDAIVPGPGYWRGVLRVLKPGAHLLAFSSTRTADLLGISLRLAGFELRDTLYWLHAQGFPKARGALKPACEPILLARKPCRESSVAANVAQWGTGAINVDACRIPAQQKERRPAANYQRHASDTTYGFAGAASFPTTGHDPDPLSRWPPNVLLSHAPECTGAACVEGCPVAALDAQAGPRRSSGIYTAVEHHRKGQRVVDFGGRGTPGTMYADTGGASRFFPTFRYTEPERPFLYTAKASRAERTHDGRVANGHPTVKPRALMRWLLRLVIPPGGSIIDPFMGSGTTVIEALALGLQAFGVDSDPESYATTVARVRAEFGLLATHLVE